jgi:hypothetical protein
LVKSKSFKKKWNGTFKKNTKFDYEADPDLDKSGTSLAETDTKEEKKIEEKEIDPVIPPPQDPIEKVEQISPKIPEIKPEPKAIVPRIPIRNNDAMKNQ